MLRYALPAGLAALGTSAGAQRLAYDLETPAPAEAAESAKAPGGSAEASEGNPPWLQYALLDRLEWNIARGEDGYAWDFSALVGGDRNRVYLASSGEGGASLRLDYAELDAYYSRSLGGDWDLNVGPRYDLRPRPNRAYAALGGQFDGEKLWLGGWTYVSHKGELSARLSGFYNLTLAGPLVLQPSFELDASATDVPALGLGHGFTYAELGLRLRYEIRPHLAPYVGASWSRDLGRTARLTRAAGDDPEAKSLVAGVRSEF
jgi:copper resistance protein B